MPVEIICSLIAAAGVITSALVSYLISHSAAKREIQNLQMTWKREDIISSDADFADMSASVAKYAKSGNSGHQRDALAKIAAIRSVETGSIAIKLDTLYFEVKNGNLSKTDICLTEAIEEKRKYKRET